VTDRVVSVEDREGEEDRAQLPHAEEDGRRLGQRRQHSRDPVTALDAVSCQGVCRLIREILEFAPGQLAVRAVEALPDHCELVARMTITNIVCNVVSRRHIPTVKGPRFVIAISAQATALPTRLGTPAS
jgi:hypothetical protein